MTSNADTSYKPDSDRIASAAPPRHNHPEGETMDRMFWGGGDCPACKQMSKIITSVAESRVQAALERERPRHSDLEEQLGHGQRSSALLQVCELLESEHRFATMKDNQDLYVYDKREGVYEKEGELTIRRELQKHYPRISQEQVNAIIEKVRDRNHVRREQFDSDPDWLHVGNGWVNIRTRKFARHSPKRYSLSKVPHKYDPKAKNPKQREFFEQVLEPEDIPVVQKFYGYLLLPDNRYKKAFGCVGKKDTGKSKFLELAERFAGSVSHVSLHDLEKYNHNVAKIAKSVLNTTSEVSKYKLRDVMLFNRITGGDECTFREIYERPFDARVRAKFLQASNELPDYDGMDQVFIERWVLLHFGNVFGQGEADERIIDKLTTPEEMSGLLNYALDGLEMLLRDGYFKNESYEQLRSKWNEVSNKLAGYAEQYLEFEAVAYVLATDLYSHYVEHTDASLNEVGFGRELKKSSVKHIRKTVNGRQRWVYQGVRLRTGDAAAMLLGNFDNSPHRTLPRRKSLQNYLATLAA